MVRFLAEIAKRRKAEIHPVPFDYENGIYIISISPHPEESYWVGWGGYYDNFAGTGIELYYRQFLRRAEDLEDLLHKTVQNMFCIDMENYTVYIKIPMHPWLYPDYGTQVHDVMPVISSALNPDQPYDNKLRGEPAIVRLSPPSFTVNLSDGMSGVNLNQGFSIGLENSDGFFDSDEEWGIFNAPVRLLKSFAENPAYEDFRLVRDGLSDCMSTGFDSFRVSVSDKFRAMSAPACKILEGEKYNGYAIGDKAKGKNIPLVYGIKKVPLIDVTGDNDYLAAEYVERVYNVKNREGAELPVLPIKNNIIRFDYSAVAGVYRRDNEPITTFTKTENGIQLAADNAGKFPPADYITGAGGNRIPHRYDNATGLITFDNADSALVAGYTANKTGEIIIDIADRIGGHSYIKSFWNKTEVDRYTAASPKVNIAIDGGDVKSAVQKTLKSDMAYFIQQSDGKFTIRKWGRKYGVHSVPAWAITNAPEKDYEIAAERYFSSCVILYESGDGETKKSLLFNEMEKEAEIRYRKLKTETFETDLADRTAAEAAARLLSGRYATMRQTVTLPVGIDTSKMELLDRVVIAVTVNGREFSKAIEYAITGINPAQDILTLEETEHEPD